MQWTDRDRLAVATLRGLALDMPARAQSGHSGTALALAPLGWLLYSRVVRHDPAHPDWPERDRVVFSNGHACVLLYGLLHLCGYALTLDDLKAFRRPGSLTPGHPESWVTPGVDASTGPLGQGLAMAVGMALAARHLGGDHHTWVLCSDGDLMEGVASEASSLAGHLGLGRLIVFYDDNSVTIDGPTSRSWSESVPDRYRAYGWHVVDRCDGEDPDSLWQAIEAARADERPSLVCVQTVIGFPSPGMSGKSEAHSPHFSPEEIRATRQVLGIEGDFTVPVGLYQPQHQGRPADWPPRPQIVPPVFTTAMATRVASGKVLDGLELPQLVGGSADLAGSTCTTAGRLNFGVREFAMACIVNGMAQHGGVVPYCSTYFAFSDYMKPALRLAALSRLPSLFVWSHDSLALGEDGPTHQPVEQLATLRALPNFWTVRPADANETAEGWALALARSDGPVGLVLSRQTLPCLPPSGKVARGAYELHPAVGEARVTLLASGAEVHLCCQAREVLQAQGIGVRVVSMPCWELFERQSAEYQREVLGSAPRVAVEAAASLGWHRWAGTVLGLDRFGASGPGAELMALFGFTVEAVVALARSVL